MSTSEQYSIVVVDVDDGQRRALSDYLQMHGHSVSSAKNCTTGLMRIQTINPDLAFIAIGRADGEASAIATQLKLARDRTFLVAMTEGAETQEALQRLRDAGFDSDVAKPMDPEAIETALRKAHARLRGGR